MVKRWTGSVVFAPPQSESDRLAITTFKAWRLKEPVSGRRYTVVKLETRGGAVGYGECGPSVGSEIAGAKAAIVGKRATDAEFIRHHLASSPGMESAVNNAMLDVAARSANVPVYQFLGGPTGLRREWLLTWRAKTKKRWSVLCSAECSGGSERFPFPSHRVTPCGACKRTWMSSRNASTR